MFFYNLRLIDFHKIIVFVIACIMLSLNFAAYSFATEISWSNGSRVHAVVTDGSTTNIESGYVTNFDENICRVKWDLCNCETLEPVDKLYRSLSEAQRMGAVQKTGDSSFNEAAQSAGRMGLLSMLLSPRGRE